MMRIGILKERKDGESRVSCTPQGVSQLVANGHEVYIETQAGEAVGIYDDMYKEAGGEILETPRAIFENSQLIYKVKEIETSEYSFIKENHVIMSFLHTNSNVEETRALLNSRCVAIAFEDITDENGSYPILKPMSELAGRIGFTESLQLLKSTKNGPGLLLNKIADLRLPEVVIFGAGNAGLGAAELACAFGNKVTVLGRGLKNLRRAKALLPKEANCFVGTKDNILKACSSADVIINCVLWPKNRKGHLLTIKDLEKLSKNCLIVDVSCDERGAIESCRSTSISDPTYKFGGHTHFCVDNLPAYYASTATEMFCQSTLPYVLEVANKGIVGALESNQYLSAGLTTFKGFLTLKETAIKQDRTYTPINHTLLSKY